MGGKEWRFEALAVPQMGHVLSTEIDDPITMEQFLSSTCRRCDGIRNTILMFDVRSKIPEFGGLARLGELIQGRGMWQCTGELLSWHMSHIMST